MSTSPPRRARSLVVDSAEPSDRSVNRYLLDGDGPLRRRRLFPIWAFPETADATTDEQNYVEYFRGDLPIVLVVPHDGSEAPDDLTQRTTARTGCRGGQFTTGRDTNTIAIARAISSRLRDLSRAAPYLVAATISRTYIDFNRDSQPQDCAYEQTSATATSSAQASTYWQAFYQKIEDFVDDMAARWPISRAFLIDIHGFGSATVNQSGNAINLSTIVLGLVNNRVLPLCFNDNVRTQNTWQNGFIYNAITGFHTRLLARAQEGGYNVYPAAWNVPYAGGVPNGGFNVQRFARRYQNPPTYGGPQAAPTRPIVDTVQLEFGSNLRGAGTRETIAEIVAEALWQSFLDHYWVG
ncbi:MAG: N-formylglutamate amidohydrolase [Bryobacteraceae bacterium]